MSKKKFNPIIQTTTNYGMFKFVNGNRDINQVHVRRLRESFEENPLVAFIIVNERYQIIDGQHRFLVMKELGLPINYVVVYGYGVREVQILNMNGSDWKKSDFLKGYVKKGLQDYIEFQNFQRVYPDLNFSTCIKLLSGFRSDGTTYLGNGLKTKSIDFESGNFKIKDLAKSYKYADMIMEYKRFFPKFNDNSFIVSLMYLFEHPDFKHKEMIKKLELQPSSLIPCKNQKQYLAILQDIYNHHRKGDKVYFTR